ncbi:MAG: hypothetical protein HQL01_11650 [Nitrospirae bacterium]|nr:hypothetical protein [Nitrospirota bacterium]
MAIDLVNLITSGSAQHEIQNTHGISMPHTIDTKNCTIGIISIIRKQCDLIKEMIDEGRIPHAIVERHEIMVGTPEEFQGHEKDIIIFSLCLDSSCNRGTGHYQNPNRLNVATSRAKNLMIFIYSDIPKTFDKIIEYRNHFVQPDLVIDGKNANAPKAPCKFDISICDSEFEREVYHYLQEYIDSKKPLHELRLCNQVISCGQKRLDFVIHNPKSMKYTAVEVDGSSHFITEGNKKQYSEQHIERMEILIRDGWKIINTPYYRWYNGGWLSDRRNLKIFDDEINRIYKELDNNLDLS